MHFVHLGIHTEFSITESIVRIPDLIKAAVNDENARFGTHGFIQLTCCG